MSEHFDVLIVGAGLSGIGAGLSPADQLPGQDATRSSRRASAIGGTWDLFRYPGIRSDSDMYTLGYSFRPWTEREGDRRRRRRSSATSARPRASTASTARSASATASCARAWSIDDARWTVDGERGDTGETVAVHLRLPVHVQRLLRYDERLHAGVPGHRALRRPRRPPAALARRPRLRRQARRRDRQRRDGGDARAGDGRAGRARDDAAALADATSSRCPARDPSRNVLRRVLPAKLAYARSRAGRTCCSACCSSSSAAARPSMRQERCCVGGVRARSSARTTTSTRTSRRRYNPWDQRVCLVPDGDLFEAISDGSASIVTDHDRDVHRDAASSSSPARSSRPTSSSPRPA